MEIVETSIATQTDAQTNGSTNDQVSGDGDDKTVLKVTYAATTNRMLRVAVNGFFESLGLVVQVMEDLDEDVVMQPGTQGLEGVQGLQESRALD